MNLNFIKTIEVKEFKTLVKTESINVFKNCEGKPYMKYTVDDTEHVFPVSQQSPLKDIQQDPVITICENVETGEVLYMLHKRSDKAHSLQFSL